MTNNINGSEIIKAKVKINKIFFPRTKVQNGDWVAMNCDVEEVLMGELQDEVLDKSSRISVSGYVPAINFVETYILTGRLVQHETYGLQYEVIHLFNSAQLTTKEQQQLFLNFILTENQVARLYLDLPDPFDAIKNEDVKKLITVSGIGAKTACKIIQKYKETIDLSEIYIELSEFGISKLMIEKLLEEYTNPYELINKIKENPYILIDDITGIGWKKADEIALHAGIAPDSDVRVKAYISYYLKEQATLGNSWVHPTDLFYGVVDNIDIDEDRVRQLFYELNEAKILWWNEEKTRMGLWQYYNLESKIAEELHRLLSGETKHDIIDKEEILKKIEIQQNWEFTTEQHDAINKALESQVLIITGNGGTGKSSVVDGVLKILNNLTFAQTALSGRAASRLAEITKEEGHTIHRLLEYSPKTGFMKNADNQLSHDIIILDEISMVGADLFLKLLVAIPTGSKLIMIGDEGQLESIGLCNIFKDMLDSNKIPLARLTEIHRQAKKSAIITESLKVRNRQQLVTTEWSGEEIRGELKDFELNVYNDSILTPKRIINKYEGLLDKGISKNDIQVVVPMRHKGESCTFVLNNILQNIANPSFNADSTKISYKKEGKLIEYTLKVGDKVIVNANNYKTYTVDGENCPIFNGNKGEIEEIDVSENVMIVNFEQYGKIIIPKSKWLNIELAYALTCHKLQGSESPYVIIGLDFSSFTLLTKEWLYTAITRAKKYCILCAEAKALSYTITKTNISNKKTHLKDFLSTAEEEEEVREFWY